MNASTFDVAEKHRSIKIFKADKLWVFKYFFEDKGIFKALLAFYNKDSYRFELKTLGERNKALKLLESFGFDYELIEDLTGYVVRLEKSSKYAPVLKNSVAFKETTNDRIFLIKDLAAVEEALSFGAKIYEGSTKF
jgi:hypothetical protein